eukprot:351219-Chlamydomonas_euryale.AAC.3
MVWGVWGCGGGGLVGICWPVQGVCVGTGNAELGGISRLEGGGKGGGISCVGTGNVLCSGGGECGMRWALSAGGGTLRAENIFRPLAWEAEGGECLLWRGRREGLVLVV